MNAQQLVQKINNLGITLVVDGDKLKIELNGKKLTSGIVEQLRENKARIMTVLKSGVTANDTHHENSIAYDFTLDELKEVAGEKWRELENDNEKLFNFIFTHKALKENANRYHNIPVGYCNDVSVAELENVLGGDIEALKNDKALLLDFLIAYATAKKISQGITPDHYTQDVHCVNCGDVKLWEGCPDVVQGCPWCLSKK